MAKTKAYKSLGKELSPKQKTLAEERVHGKTIKEAAIKAGYSVKTADANGWQALQVPKVKAYMEEYAENWRRSRARDSDRVLEELRLIAFSSLEKVIQVTGSGLAYFDFRRADSEFWRGVEAMTVRHYPSPNGPEVIETKVKLWNKPQALRMLGSATGSVPTTVAQIGLEDDSELETIESPRARLLAKLEVMRGRLAINLDEISGGGPIIDVTPEEKVEA